MSDPNIEFAKHSKRPGSPFSHHHNSMPPVPQVQVSQLSPKQLRQQLLVHGIEVGPILPTTRGIYEKKLLECMTGQAPEPNTRYDPVDDDDDDEVIIPSQEQPVRTPTSPTVEIPTPVVENFGAGSPAVEKQTPVSDRYGHIYGTLEENNLANPCSRYTVCTPVRRRPLHQTPGRTAFASSTSPTPAQTENTDHEERGLPLAVKVCILILVLFIGYLVYINLEPSTSNRIPGKVVSNV